MVMVTKTQRMGEKDGVSNTTKGVRVDPRVEKGERDHLYATIVANQGTWQGNAQILHPKGKARDPNAITARSMAT